MPSTAPLAWLLERLVKLIRAATDALETSYPDGVHAWQQEVSRQLARYHAAALMAGANAPTLTSEARVKVTSDLATQLKFLEKFGVEIQEGNQWERGWQARAEMYARSIQVPYWRGATKMLPLPALPGDGSSTCLTNCKCLWDVQQLDGDGNYDATWRTSSTEQCATCIQRGQDWAPLQIRDGVLQV